MTLDYTAHRGARNRGVKPRLGDVIEVEWLDSQHIALGWVPRRDYRKAVRSPQSYRTAGYLLDWGRSHVVIALSIDPANGHVTHAMSIPRAVVVRHTVLGRSNKRVREAIR